MEYVTLIETKDKMAGREGGVDYFGSKRKHLIIKIAGSAESCSIAGDGLTEE